MVSKVLVCEPIASGGIDLLRQHCDVDVELNLTPEELADRIEAYDALLIRSATQVTEELIARGSRLKVIGRAGIGVDNVDVAAATRAGIIVANAPQSNIVAAAEHTIALMLSLARKVPQAHQALSAGRWERPKFSGVELYEKTLGILGFGRIGQLVAERARGFGMKLLAFDPYVGADRFSELGVQRAETIDAVLSEADFLTLHLPRNEETRGTIDREAIAKMKPTARIINCARGELVVDEDLKEALDEGRLAGAALDVFVNEPVTEHPLFADRADVVVTPHLGASTSEAQDRAGVQTAEQLVAGLTGGVVSTAVNIPSVSGKEREALQPFLSLCERLGTLAIALRSGPSVDRVEVEVLGTIAALDTRLLTVAVLKGMLAGRVEQEVNYVNAPSIAQDRGIRVGESRDRVARDFSDLVRVSVISGEERVRVTGTTLGRRHRPHLLEAWGQRFNLQLDDPHLALFRYQDVPGIVGRLGSLLGDRGINISSAAVGRQPPVAPTDGEKLAVMAISTDSKVPDDLIADIVADPVMREGCSVSLNLESEELVEA